MKFITLFFEHLSSWGLVWFGLVFWGSIFNAILLYFQDNNLNLMLTVIAYCLGLIFGLAAKYKEWSWIN